VFVDLTSRFIAWLGVLGARPSSTVKDKLLALDELLDALSGLDFYEDKKLFAELKAGLHTLRMPCSTSS
jgi:hypothetical protein